jgi:3-phenylpropionate/trans-cinnamate dioxygenase ferredoxin subunit
MQGRALPCEMSHNPGQNTMTSDLQQPEFVAVAKVDEVPAGSMKVVAVERDRVLLAHVEGRFYAIRDVCGHRGVRLSAGTLDGCMVECPRHYALFDVRNGWYVAGPFSQDQPTYDVRVDGDTVLVKRQPNPLEFPARQGSPCQLGPP